MSTPTITNVSSCTTTACAFNDGGCNAYAITVGGENAAACGTFTTLDIRAGISDAHSEVGACHRLDCTHNKDLMCAADSISIVGESAMCADYNAR
ncbi:hypothetical protein COCCU_00695 [Corynebacterium occultum]|uniref:DUF1540 domain-containing protein n=1 Tax=Corynebacterium occultum TaxID=2675219 RepID=A0A6B8W267_9CORY|nr:DUF1540 domain-containing protein [Corynebacterium occultum]QGU06107.1 hypothetical protein COCCU_00695 [Corynebacterium occultum]